MLVIEEELALVIYFALIAEDFHQDVALGADHDSNSDSTGAIAGNPLNAQRGEQDTPENGGSRWNYTTSLSSWLGVGFRVINYLF